jgi:hypothetical protein
MKVTSSIRSTESKSSTNSETRREVTRPGVFAAIFFAATLALAPLSTFAQHGGGGGGGGSHGGGGGGGSHASSGGGSHGTSSGASSGSAAAHGTTSTASSNSSAAGGNAGTSASHWWNPFHGSNTGSNTNPPAERFAAGNNTWVEPPARGAHGTTGTGATNSARGVSGGPRAAVSSPPHIPVRPRPIGFAPFYPLYPYGFFGPGFGFGFGSYYGAFGPCDPFWGCYGYGFGDNGGYGYYGGSFSSGYGADLSYSGAEDMSPGEDSSSQEGSPTLFALAPETSQGQESATAGPATKPVSAVLYLKDGSSYAVTDYWLADGKIHYVTSYGGQNSVDQSALDLQKTVNENAAQGLTFTLRPAAVSTSGAVAIPQ